MWIASWRYSHKTVVSTWFEKTPKHFRKMWKKDGHKSYQKTIKMVQWARKKGHEGLIAGEGRVKCIQLYEYAMFCYAVCLPSTPLNIHYYFFTLKQKITFTEFSVLFLSSLKYSSSAKTFSVFPASQNCDPAKDSSHKTTAEDK